MNLPKSSLENSSLKNENNIIFILPDMPDHTQEKLHYKIAFGLEYILITIQELDFSQPCLFYRFSKVVYHWKPKNHIDGLNVSSKSVLPTFFKALRACLTKPKENYIIKL